MAKFLIDENVPYSVAEYLQAQGHEVVSVKEALLEGTPDPVVAKVAEEQQAILVTWNIKHFRREIRRRSLGILAFRCSEPTAAERLEQEYHVIEFELQNSIDNNSGFWVEIQQSGIKFIRRDSK